MKSPRLREEVREIYINKYLSSLKGQKVILWQAREDKKECNKAILTKVNLQQGLLRFFPDTENLFQFLSPIPLYFYSPSSSLIFKTRVFFQTNSCLEIRCPELIMLHENRINKRTRAVSDNAKITLEIKRDGREIKLTKPLIDFGENGLSFQMSKEEIPLIYENDIINIVGSKEIHQFNNAQVKIRYIVNEFDGVYYLKTSFRVGGTFVN